MSIRRKYLEQKISKGSLRYFGFKRKAGDSTRWEQGGFHSIVDINRDGEYTYGRNTKEERRIVSNRDLNNLVTPIRNKSETGCHGMNKSPHEKANELVSYYLDLLMPIKKYQDNIILHKSKQCAIRCVDEIMNTLKDDLNNPDNTLDDIDSIGLNLNWWKEVKKEIEKL